MVNRRHIRIKVMQSVYAFLHSKNDNLTKEEKFLKLNIEKAHDLYVLQLLLMVEVKNMAKAHLEIKKNKYLATSEDKNPNLKFINNQLIHEIEESISLKKYVDDHKLDNWKTDSEYVRVILDEIQKSDLYKNYMSSTKNSFEEDKNFIINVFKEIIAPNEKLFDYYESQNLGWVDDFPFVNTWVIKALKQLKPLRSFELKGMKIEEDDIEFMKDLFRKTVLNHKKLEDEIDGKTPNWENERIADIDMILIKMALTEFLYFPSIPTKVTINEYIEISKDYSTQKSSYFINGVLDKLLKEYQDSDRLQKIGRGLM
ncbi:MAG: transcription antitermination factor NusB [Bacteroidota bacterium]